jgi:pyrroline-5-carboxylate reductase
MRIDNKIGFIGGGAMAQALIKGLLAADLVLPSQIQVYNISPARAEKLRDIYGINVAHSIRAVATSVDVLFLAVKPQVIPEVLENIAPFVTKDTLVISVAAGVSLAFLQKKLGEVPVIRVMPNTPVAVGAGMSVIALGEFAGKENGALAVNLFSSVGKALILQESYMDAVIAVSGSGPGYVFVLLDALADAGVNVGLSREQSLLLAAQTLMGAAKMALETGEHPGKLRDMVTSPGGTTIAGIHVLEQRGVRGAIMDAVKATFTRSQEMGKKTDG